MQSPDVFLLEAKNVALLFSWLAPFCTTVLIRNGWRHELLSQLDKVKERTLFLGNDAWGRRNVIKAVSSRRRRKVHTVGA